MIKCSGQSISSFLFLVLGILVVVESINLSHGTIHNPGPGFVPFYIGLLMVVLSILMLLERDKKSQIFWSRWDEGRAVFFVLLGLVGYLVLFNKAGFFLATFLLLAYLMKISGEQGYKKTLIMSVVTVVFIYMFFYKFLGVPFPLGLLGI